jgi:hypothetical protein
MSNFVSNCRQLPIGPPPERVVAYGVEFSPPDLSVLAYQIETHIPGRNRRLACVPLFDGPKRTTSPLAAPALRILRTVCSRSGAGYNRG